jgi:RDD family
MAAWDPPQPLWKRNLAGVLDFLLAFLGFGYLLFKLGLGRPASPPGIGFHLGLAPTLLVNALIIAYFVVLGRTGGTIFQRLFGMKRAKADAVVSFSSVDNVWDPPQPLWKRNLAGILDFLLAFLSFGLLFVELGLAKFVRPNGLFPLDELVPPFGINLQLGPAMVLLALIIAYFVALERTGGTVFQRLLGMKRKDMTVWDPPQPLWKRILIGVLDFLLALTGFGLLSGTISIELLGPPDRSLRIGLLFKPWPTLLLLVFIVAYFVVLGRTGGTVFQRLFRMKRAEGTHSQPELSG